MMNKTLNLNVLKTAMDHADINQAQLATELDVSKETVLDWLQATVFPSPDKLLKLGLLLGLSFDELVKPIASPSEPVVAFGKKGSTTATNIAHAKNLGRMLTVLVPYVPYDEFIQPATLKKPVNDYVYLQKIVAKIRAEIGVGLTDVLDFRHLIKKFNELQAVLIPVLWGQQENHDNALHIYLPDSMTTWIYLNLDSEIHDFKFWMAHELGHVYAPSLTDNEAEAFADAFATALLFPEPLAKSAYEAITQREQIETIHQLAQQLMISPLSIYSELNKYAHYHHLPEVDLGKAMVTELFHHPFSRLTEILFDGKTPTPAVYLKTTTQLFDTPFFDTLQKYLVNTKKSAGFIQNILDIPLLDAQAIYTELC
jgi:Zn-dependent peptidase ImmA (M78 family)/DNA-binding XRE family transcriptional regulator